MTPQERQQFEQMQRDIAEWKQYKQERQRQQISYPLDEVSKTIISGDSTGVGFVNLGDQSALTIASGSITPTTGYHEVDTEAAASTDDLDTIAVTNVVAGDLLVIRAVNSGRTVVLKDGTGNLRLAGDMSLDHDRDTITLTTNGTVWYEIARSNNDV
jgi:hypothetical protein